MARSIKGRKVKGNKTWKMVLGYLSRCIKWIDKGIDKILIESKKLVKKLGKSKRREFKFELLLDKPLSADKSADVRFGHEQIAETIVNLVACAKPPFTLGLFGKWGTGKTTIIGLTEKKLSNVGIRSVTFDAWKYKDDSLRRQFLITLDEKLKLGLKYKKVLNQNLTQPAPLSGLLLFRQLFGLIVPLSLLVMVIVLFYGFFKGISWTIAEGLQNIINGIFNVTIIGITSNLLMNVFTRIMEVSYGTIELPKTDSAEGFEDRFYNEVLPAIEQDKVLIVIDNLDRTSSEVATKLLSDVKTFLAKDSDYSSENKNNKAIFLIACDDFAIKRHLEKSKFDNPEEFLRKFFNCSIRIPMFLDIELDRYTEELIGKTAVGKFINNRQLIWLVTYSFRGNPREIKQFINTLIAQYLLARNMQKSSSVLKTKEITNNVEFLAKILIVRQKYPNIYNNIEEKSLRLGLEWKEIEDESDQVLLHGEKLSEDAAKENDGFNRFIEDSKHIKQGYLPLFIRLRQSEDEQKLDSWSVFVLAAVDKQIEDARKIFKKIRSGDNLPVFDELAKDFVVKEKRRSGIGSGTDRLISFGSVTIMAAEDGLPLINNFLEEFIPKLPRSSDLLNRISDFRPSLYFEKVYPLLTDINRERLLETYLSLFGLQKDTNKSPLDSEIAKEIFEIIIEHQEYFDKKVGEIQTAIEKYFWDFQYLEMFVSKKLIGKFITTKAKENYVKSIGAEDLVDLKVLGNKLSLLNKLI